MIFHPSDFHADTEYLIRDRSGTHTSVPLSLPRAPTAEVVPPRDLGTSGEGE